MNLRRVSSISGKASAELALLVLSLVVGVGLARLTTAPFASGTVARIALCVLTGHLVTSVAAHLAPRRWTRVWAGLAGFMSVGIVCGWLFASGLTIFGIPTWATVRGLADSFGRAGQLITSHPTPLPPTPAVVLCVAAGSGCAAVAARLLAVGRSNRGGSSSIYGLLPSAAVFCYTALLSSDVDRVQGAMAYVGALLFYATAVDAVRWRGRVALGVASGATVLAMVLGAGVALSSMQVDALPFHQPGTGFGASSGPGTGPASGIDALDLIDNLRGVITYRSKQPMFSAMAAQPTYWQIASLTGFDGVKWTPDPATTLAADGNQAVIGPFLPVLPQPSAASEFDAEVTIDDLYSALLPVPPATYAVGSPSAAVVPSIGVYRSPATTPGFSYSASSREPTASVGAGGYSGMARSALAPYLALPKVDGDVVSLAHAIAKGKTTPLAKAVALVRYFDSSGFKYSLAAQPASSDPLHAFLFVSHLGFCQQFAGAYAVLARIDGLPTRIGVGFTPGKSSGGSFHVTGADAHVWPQVYLGPSVGWVSFEPTPTAGSATGTPGVLSGSSSVPGLPPPPAEARAGTGSSLAHGAGGSSEKPSLQAPGKRPPVRSHVVVVHGPRVRSSTIWIWILVASAGVMAGLGLEFRRRRPRWADVVLARFLPPPASVVASWRCACRDLARRRLGRMATETIAEHSRRCSAESGASAPHFARLGLLAQRAIYGQGDLTAEDAAEARQLRSQVGHEMAKRRPAPTSIGWSRS